MQWGAWDGAGMALSNPAILKQAHTSGIGILDPRAGLGATRAVLDETDVGRYWRGAREGYWPSYRFNGPYSCARTADAL